MTFLNYLISGISLGSIYAIIALGYTMVYGIAKMLNVAHGDVIMVGAYICFYAVSRYSLPPLVGVILAMLVCTVLGIVVERLAYKPLRSAPSLAVLITAIGVSYFLQNAALLLWSSNPKVFPNAFVINTTDEAGNPVVQSSIDLFGGQLKVSFVTIATIAICIVIMLALLWFTSKTRLGKAMRACSEDKAAAQLTGIDVNRTISMTFAIGSALAAVAGVLLCSTYPTLMPTTGSLPGIKAFTAAVFGGIGSIPGAMLGGILLGIIAGLLCRAFLQLFKGREGLSIGAAAVLSTICHTVMVLGCLALFFREFGMGVMSVVLSLVTVSSVAEMLIAAVVATVVGTAAAIGINAMGTNLRVEVVDSILGKTPLGKKIVVIIRDVFIILFYVMVTYGGYQLCTRAKQAVSTMPQFTMGQVYTIFPIAGVLCILSAVLNLVVELTTKPEGGESK